MSIKTIPQSVWLSIQNDVEEYVDCSIEKTENLRKKILNKINGFIKIYPHSVDLLATKADYLRRLSQRETCLLKAYSMAKRLKDLKNQTLIASSLAVFYIDDLENYDEGNIWLLKLKDALLSYFDEEEQKTFDELKTKFDMNLIAS